ncbi:MAG: hypothetical protein AAF658_16945, partial [Myxococcota bacterium]
MSTDGLSGPSKTHSTWGPISDGGSSDETRALGKAQASVRGANPADVDRLDQDPHERHEPVRVVSHGA